SGGIDSVYHADGKLRSRCNMGMVELEELSTEDAIFVAELLEEHVLHTGSERAKSLLSDWEHTLSKFIKVVPTEYRRVLEAMADGGEQVSARRDSLSVFGQSSTLGGGPPN